MNCAAKMRVGLPGRGPETNTRLPRCRAEQDWTRRKFSRLATVRLGNACGRPGLGRHKASPYNCLRPTQAGRHCLLWQKRGGLAAILNGSLGIQGEWRLSPEQFQLGPPLRRKYGGKPHEIRKNLLNLGQRGRRLGASRLATPRGGGCFNFGGQRPPKLKQPLTTLPRGARSALARVSARRP